MPAGSHAPTRPTAYQLVPYWRALLAERGLSPATIEHFAIAPRGDGWLVVSRSVSPSRSTAAPLRL